MKSNKKVLKELDKIYEEHKNRTMTNKELKKILGI